MRFDVLTAVNMQIVIWVMTSTDLLIVSNVSEESVDSIFRVNV